MLNFMKGQTNNSQESLVCKHLSQKERSKSYGGWNCEIYRWDILDEQNNKLLLSKVNELQREINPYEGDQNPKKRNLGCMIIINKRINYYRPKV